MNIDSVRELKASLPKQLEDTFALKASPRAATMAVANAASRRHSTASYFLGISANTRKDFRLAVRLQDRGLERSALVQAITARAKGEVDVRYVGRIRARAEWYRARNRPLRIGGSTGFLPDGFIMAGTLGCFVKKVGAKALYILSNNHVLADENRYPINAAIVQPGTLDGGRATADRVATLSAFVRIRADQTNLVDCATAKLKAGIVADVATIQGVGKLAGVIARDLDIHDVVHKVGRTTGLRHGRVTAIELDGVTVEYDMGVATFDNQIEIEGSGTRSFSDAGDSGSLIVDDERKGAALLFAGGDHGGANEKGLTYGNPIQAVLSALKVELAY